MAKFHTHIPQGPLGRVVDSITYAEGLGTGIALQRAYQVIIINVGDNFFTCEPYGSETPVEHTQTVWISGKHETPFALQNFGEPKMFVISPKPGLLPFFISVPVMDTNNEALTAEHWGSKAIYELRDRLLAESDTDACFAMIEEYFTQQIAHADLSDVPTIEMIANAMPVKTVQDLCTGLGWARKRLLAMAEYHLGGSIKSIQGILRYDEHLGAMANDPERSLSSIHAFYDQAHFINDFKARTGMTPSEYQRICRSCPAVKYTPNFIPLQRETFLQLLGRSAV